VPVFQRRAIWRKVQEAGISSYGDFDIAAEDLSKGRFQDARSARTAVGQAEISNEVSGLRFLPELCEFS
jgi:hypothetical protein